MCGRIIASYMFILFCVILCTFILDTDSRREGDYAYSQTALSEADGWSRELTVITKQTREHYTTETALTRCERACNDMFALYVTDDFSMACRTTCYEIWAKR